MSLLLTAVVYFNLQNSVFKILFSDNYILLPLDIDFLEVPHWHALWGSSQYIPHLICMTQTLPIQLRLHDSKEVKSRGKRCDKYGGRGRTVALANAAHHTFSKDNVS